MHQKYERKKKTKTMHFIINALLKREKNDAVVHWENYEVRKIHDKEQSFKN